MDSTKITRQRDGLMESYMVITQITRPRDRRHKNNSPKGWTVKWSAQKQLAKGWRIKWSAQKYPANEVDGTKLTPQRDGRMKS